MPYSTRKRTIENLAYKAFKEKFEIRKICRWIWHAIFNEEKNNWKFCLQSYRQMVFQLFSSWKITVLVELHILKEEGFIISKRSFISEFFWYLKEICTYGKK